MMKKFFTRFLAALALLVCMMPTLALRAAEYEIIFKSASSDSSSDLGASPQVSNVVESGTDYVASFSGCSKMYVGKSGIKLGTSSATGTMNFTLATDYQANIKTIKVVSAKYGNDTGTLTLYSGTTSLHSGITPGTDYTYTFNNPATVTSIKLATSAKRAYITKIVITTEESGTVLEDSDLAITGAPVALSFDLYDNSTAQTVSFTTSSTGAVTVSGGTGYVTTSLDGNTITVEPVAVTPSAQTITVSQAADDTYAAGSATFTVEVADSTPFDGVIFDATEDTGTSPIVKDNVSFACSNGVLNNGSEYRLYKNSITTISTTDGSKITKIEFTGTSSNPASGFATQTGWTTSGDNGVWTGEATSVSFTASGAQVRATLIKVWVTPNTNPSITADDVEIAYNATSGSITCTINNVPSPAGTLSAGIKTGTTPTIASFNLGTVSGTTVPFTCAANTASTTRTVTVTLTYTYGDSQTVTKDVTVTQAGNPDAVDLISNINATGTTYTIRGTVVALNARGCVIGDGTGYINFYNGHTAPLVAVNDIVTVSGSMTSYGNVYQFSNNSPNTATIATAQSSNYDDTPAITVITEIPSAYSTGLHLSDYFQFEGTLTKSNGYYYVAVGSGQINIAYPSQTQQDAMTALENKNVRVKGYFSGINSSNYFTVMMESVEEVAEPSITLTYANPDQHPHAPNSPYEFVFTYESGGGNIDEVTYENFDNTLTAESFSIQFYNATGEPVEAPDWVLDDYGVVASNDHLYLHFYVNVNTVATPRTCYFKVGAANGTGGAMVYSDLVTVTQAAAPHPVITVTPSTVNATADETDGTLTVAYEYINTGANVSIDWYEDAQGNTLLNEAPNWILAAFATGDINTIEYTIGANNGEARTAYFKVSGADNYSNEVNSDMVTINQAAPVPTYEITFDVGDGTFIGNDDFPDYVAVKEAGTYTLPSATKALYTFTGWNVGDETYAAGAQYTVTDDVDFVAGYTPGVMYNFAGANNFYTDSQLTTHPGTGSSNKVGTIYYGDGSVFVASQDNGYFSAATSGYFMLGKENATLTLPTFSGYKITQVKIHSSTSHSESVAVSIVSGTNTASNAQTWSTKDKDYTYSIGEDYQTSTLAVKVTNNYNAQITSITLVLEAYDPNVLSTMDAIYNKAVEVGTTLTEVQVNFGGWIVTGVKDDNVFVTDGTKGFVIQEEDHGFEVGNTLTGTVTCNIELAGSFNARITGVKASDLTIGSGTPTATTIPMAELSGINTGALVTYNGLTYNSNGTLSDGVTSIKKTNYLYNSNNDFTSGLVYNVTGVIWGYNSDVEINPRSANDIVLVPASITFTAISTAFTPDDAYHIELPSDPSGGNIDYVNYVNIPNISGADDFHVAFCDANGGALSADPDWFEEVKVVSVEEQLVLYVSAYGNTSDARTAYFKVWAYTSATDQVYSDIVTVTQAEYVAPFAPTLYTKATSITSEGHYIIVGFNGNDAYAMGDQNNSIRSAVVISEDGTNAIVVNENVFDFVITGNATDGYTIYDTNNDGYLCAVSSSNNYIGTGDSEAWTITFNETDGYATVISTNTDYDRKDLRYNYNNGNTPRFSCYKTTTTMSHVYLYEKSTVAPSTNSTTVDATSWSAKAGYRLIASPFNNINPKAVEGMLGANNKYDLYYFDENGLDNVNDEEVLAEWRNYKANPFFLERGKGYLYANETGVELSFSGVPYNEGTTFNVGLQYTEGNRLAGWNLVGNPFTNRAYLENSPDFYVMNTDGTELVPVADRENNYIYPMEGIFVIATGSEQHVTFTTTAPGSNNNTGAKMILNVMKDRGNVVDRVIVRFGEGEQLPKFMLNPDNSKLYIPQGNKDYAVVRSNGQGEMPVSFKAETSGTYTINVKPENVDVTYLHLIDNRTGANVDLLANPSYSFEANKGDNANRFRLVFKTNTDVEDNTATETFAYFNGSEWVISNPSTGSGSATLQVIDMMGRVLSSEQINGNTAVNINQAAGIYMLRLINGENVMVQKVVVR